MWWRDPNALAEDARTSIADPLNDALVSAVTVWELEIKRALGLLTLPVDVLAAIRAVQMVCLPVTGGDAVLAGQLPPHHRDPFDRMLIAQAMRLDAMVVTRDRAFDRYDVDVIRA